MLLVAGRASFREVMSTMDRLTVNLRLKQLTIVGRFDEALRWAVLREVNQQPASGDMTINGLVREATHVVSFGVTEHAFAAKKLSKPLRLVR